MGTLNRIYRSYRERVAFYVIYIKEIHPTDGWQVEANERDSVLFQQHRSISERVETGQACMLKTGCEIPALVDGMDDAVSRAYANVSTSWTRTAASPTRAAWAPCSSVPASGNQPSREYSKRATPPRWRDGHRAGLALRGNEGHALAGPTAASHPTPRKRLRAWWPPRTSNLMGSAATRSRRVRFPSASANEILPARTSQRDHPQKISPYVWI